MANGFNFLFINFFYSLLGKYHMYYIISIHRVLKYLVIAVLQSFLFSDIFSSLNLHAIGCSPLENHIFLLIKCMAAKYLEIRFQHASSSSQLAFKLERKPTTVNLS